MQMLARDFYELSQNSYIQYFSELKSTSEYLKSHPAPNGTLVITDFQTAGKGRRDQRTWTSQPGMNFTGSWSFEVNASPTPVLPALVGLSLIELCSTFFPSMKWSLKAPNDILLEGKKCAGILIELVSEGVKTRLIVGLGFNVFSSPENAVHLLRRENDSPNLFFKLINEFNKELQTLALRSSADLLRTEEKAKLLRWLNLNVNLDERIHEITAEGDLIFETKKISWMEL